MAVWSQVAFNTVEQLVNFLNGVVIGGQNLVQGAAVDGLTLVVDIGGGDVTVTFTPAKSRPWTAQEIAAKINASIAGIARVYSRNYDNPYLAGGDQRILLERDGALTVKTTGTANALLGFSTTSNTVNDPVPTSEVPWVQYQNGSAAEIWVALLYR